MSQLNRFLLGCLLMLTSLSPLGLGQSADERPTPDQEKADDKLLRLILKVRKSHFDPLLGQSAIPALRQAFASAADEFTKLNLANVLMQYGQKDDAYWSVLYKQAQEIVDSSVPYPLVFDENGKSIRGALSPEFLQWVKDQNVSKYEAVQKQLGVFPVEFSMMAEVGDPRGLPLLRKGLTSPNFTLRMMAARGLAILGDKDSISSIIQAARTAPSEAQPLIALPLLAFDDSSAREATKELIIDKKLLESEKKILQEKGPRGVW